MNDLRKLASFPLSDVLSLTSTLTTPNDLKTKLGIAVNLIASQLDKITNFLNAPGRASLADLQVARDLLDSHQDILGSTADTVKPLIGIYSPELSTPSSLACWSKSLGYLVH